VVERTPIQCPWKEKSGSPSSSLSRASSPLSVTFNARLGEVVLCEIAMPLFSIFWTATIFAATGCIYPNYAVFLIVTQVPQILLEHRSPLRKRIFPSHLLKIGDLSPRLE